MSTTAPSPTLSSTTAEASLQQPLLPVIATIIALVAAVFALIDVFANGLALTLLHLAVTVGVFGLVRICIGVALAPYRPPLPDDPESRT